VRALRECHKSLAALTLFFGGGCPDVEDSCNGLGVAVNHLRRHGPSAGTGVRRDWEVFGQLPMRPASIGRRQMGQNRKEWHGASFRNEADDQLILKISAVKRKEWESFGFALSAMTYLAAVRELGKGAGVSCWGERVGYHPADLVGYGHILMSPQGEFRCEAYGRHTSYKFNLGVLRYIETYLEGFIDGKDTEGNTPYVTVGKCTRID
jgi:hypothetical protein